MKINNEYINTNNYSKNFFVNDINGISGGDSVLLKSKDGNFAITKSEISESVERYNKYGEESEDVQKEKSRDNRGFDGQSMEVELLKENLKSILGDMDGSDYERLKQWGMAPADDDSEAVVTVYERIQIQLMTYCENYVAAGMSIDESKMAKVLGSKAMASAVAKAGEAVKFNDNAKEYMLKNNMEPTVDNVYKAVHSAGTKDIAAVSDADIENAVSKKLVKEGYQLSNENIKNAVWLVSRQIPLTVENMTKLQELNQIDEFKAGDEEALESLSKNIAYSLYFGAGEKNVYITDRYADLSDADEAIDILNSATEEAVELVAKEDKTLNIANLKAANKYIAENNYLRDESYSGNSKSMEYKQIIFEARIVMTTTSAYNLKRLGVDINYAEISKMVEEIKSEQDSFVNSMLKNEHMVADYNEKSIMSATFELMSSFSSIPNVVAAKVYSAEISFTMKEVHSSGMSLKAQYESANITYETFGTQVRKDLGDSYKKAFNNVDNILEETGVEINEANRRAARILGYNSMEITKESIISVREIATELDFLVDNLTPKTVMYLVKNGINPLEEDISKVNDKLLEINEEIGKDDENMGKYLWKLTKNGSINDEERKDYIELYRILNMISKNDGNVIGAVINEGRECTLKNLYSAYKSKKSSGFDISLDDNSKVNYVKKSLTSFMSSAREKAIGDIINNDKDISIEKLLDINSQYDDENENRYYEEEMERYNDLLQLSSKELNSIINGAGAGSISQIAAYMEITGSNVFYKQLKEERETKDVVKAIENEINSDDRLESLDKLYEELDRSGEAIMENVKLNMDLSLERFKSAENMAKNLRYMSSMAKKKHYFVPMEINGEMTGIRLTINKGAAEYSSVTVSMECEGLGKINSSFYFEENIVSGSILADNEQGTAIISKELGVFREKVENIGMSLGKINVYSGKNPVEYKGNKDNEASPEKYYSVAKVFISSVKIWSEVK